MTGQIIGTALWWIIVCTYPKPKYLN